MKIKLMTGDALDKLKKIPDNFVDSIVTDPPAGIGFMGKDWDHDKGGRDNWIQWMTDIFTEAKRTLKPGGHCFVWALPRTSHWTATALEDAGFEIRDIITHVFGSGFPKSHNISKSIDKINGVEPIKIGIQKLGGTAATLKGKANRKDWHDQGEGGTFTPEIDITKPASLEAQQWEGWGTALKPASEHWILCRKPLSEKTIADNVLKWGVGGINIDGSRIGIGIHTSGKSGKTSRAYQSEKHTTAGEFIPINRNTEGRFPANFIHDGSDEVMKEFDKSGNIKSTKFIAKNTGYGKSNTYINYKEGGSLTDVNGGYNDEGSAARFFYCSKPSKSEKEAGLEDEPERQIIGRDEGQDKMDSPYKRRPSFEQKLKERPGLAGEKKPTSSKNSHPTIKPIKLMSYLIKMITPENGIVLDPFLGSGSTGVAAVKLNYSFIGIEKEQEYMIIAKARIEYAKNLNK